MSGDNFSMGGQVGGGFGTGLGGNANGQTHGQAAGRPAGTAGGDLIFDVTTQSFAKDVLEASRTQPVVVDFWAPWCGPCKQLGPVLESAVSAAGGAVKLAKMNIDDHPAIAGQLGIQSIPAVIAFRDGQPVDGFMGAQPESEVKAFLERIGGAAPVSETEAYLEQAKALAEAKDWAQAAQYYGAVMKMEPDNAAAITGLARCYMETGDTGRAKQILELVPEEGRKGEDFAAVKAAIDLADQAAELGDLAELQAKVDANPGDYQARFDLAVALNGRGDKNGAVDHLIEIIRRDREWNEDGARKQLLQFFEAWGFKDPASAYGRRKLSSVLFS